MREITWKELAQHMLRARDSGGYTFTQFLRINLTRYLYLIVYFGALLAFTAFIQWWTGFTAIAGVAFGFLLRDFGWIRKSGKNWPFTLEIVDWKKVEQLADEKSVG